MDLYCKIKILLKFAHLTLFGYFLCAKCSVVISVGIYAISCKGERFPHTDFTTGSNWLRGFGELTDRNLFGLEVTLLHILLRL